MKHPTPTSHGSNLSNPSTREAVRGSLPLSKTDSLFFLDVSSTSSSATSIGPLQPCSIAQHFTSLAQAAALRHSQPRPFSLLSSPSPSSSGGEQLSFLTFHHANSSSAHYTPYLSHSLPISPPAPHRRAPRPPIYAPRRHRARHIAMREPSMCGLFTVSEDPAEYATATVRMRGMPEGDVPMDVDSEGEVLMGMESESDSSTEADTDADTVSLSGSTMYKLTSAIPSSDIFPSPSPSPSPAPPPALAPIAVIMPTSAFGRPMAETLDLPLNCVDEVDSIHRLSWSSTASGTSTVSVGSAGSMGSMGSMLSAGTMLSSSGETIDTDFETRGLTTPLMENDDPFAGPASWTEISLHENEEIQTSSAAKVDQWQQSQPLPPPHSVPAHTIPRHTRRPAPLVLPQRLGTSLSRHPFSASSMESDEILTPRSTSFSSPSSRSSSRGLMPALSILSGDDWAVRRHSSPSSSPTTPTPSLVASSPYTRSPKSAAPRVIAQPKARQAHNVDLAMAFEDLLATCGELSNFDTDAEADTTMSSLSSEKDFNTKALRFPLPPARHALLIPPLHSRVDPWTPPSPPRPVGREDTQPMRMSKHSFLHSLSFGESPTNPRTPVSPASISGSSSSSSGGSSSSRRSLPGRKSLPREWTRF